MANETRGSSAPRQEREPSRLTVINDIKTGDSVTLTPLGVPKDQAKPIKGVLEDGPIETEDGFVISGFEVANVSNIKQQGNGYYSIETDSGKFMLRKAESQDGSPAPLRLASDEPAKPIAPAKPEKEARDPSKFIGGGGDPAHKMAKSIIDAMERSEMDRIIQRERDKGGFFKSLFLPNKIWEKVRTENKFRATPEIRKLIENYAIRVTTGNAVDRSSEEVYRLMENYGFRTGPNGEFVTPKPQGGIWQIFQRANPSGGTIAATMVLGSAIGSGVGSFVGGLLGGGIAGGLFGYLRGRRESEEAFGSGQVWLNEVNTGLDSGIESEIEMACHKVELLMNDPAMKNEFFRNRSRMEAAQLLTRYQEGIRRLALRRMAAEFEQDEKDRRHGEPVREQWTGGERDKHIAERYAIFCREMAESETKFARRWGQFYSGALAREVGIIAVDGAPGTTPAPVPLTPEDVAKRQELQADFQGQLHERRVARRRTFVGAITAGALIGLIPGAIGGAAGGMIGQGVFRSLSGWFGLALVGTGGALLGNKYIDRVRRKMELASTTNKIGWGANGAGGFGPYAEISSYEKITPEDKKQEALAREPRLDNRRTRNAGQPQGPATPGPLGAGINQLDIELRNVNQGLAREQQWFDIGGDLIRNYDELAQLFENVNVLTISGKEQREGELRNLAERILERKRRPEFSANDPIFTRMSPEAQGKWAEPIAVIAWMKRETIERLKAQRDEMISQREELQTQASEAGQTAQDIARDENGRIRWANVGFKMRMGRHTEKSGKSFSIRDPQMAENMSYGVQNEYGGYNYVLPEEGVMLAQREGKRIAEDLANTPGTDNAVYYFVSSNQARTQETNSIIGAELRWALRDQNPHHFNMWIQKDLANVARQVGLDDRKVLILEKASENVMGFDKKLNLKLVYEIIKERYNGDEETMMREWMESYKLQDEIGSRPDEIADKFKRWIKQKRLELGRLFPGRPIVISAVGHSWEMDAAIMGIIGREHTMEQIDEMGGMIQVMEGATITIGVDANGNQVSVLEYRDREFSINLEEDYQDQNEGYVYRGRQKHIANRRGNAQRPGGEPRANVAGEAQNQRIEDFGTENEFVNEVLLPYYNENMPDGAERYRNGNDVARAFGYNSLIGMAQANGFDDIESFVNHVVAGGAFRPGDGFGNINPRGGGNRGGGGGGGNQGGGGPRPGNNNPPTGGGGEWRPDIPPEFDDHNGGDIRNQPWW